MDSTYFEDMLKMGDTKDYKNAKPPNELYAICECHGRVKEGDPVCERNPEGIRRRNSTRCLWYTLKNGNNSQHCSHRKV